MLLNTEIAYGTLEYLMSGGWVIIPLILLSLWLWILICFKWLEFRELRKRYQSVQDCLESRHCAWFQTAGWQKAILDYYLAFRAGGIRPNQKLFQRIRHPYELAIERNIQTILVLAGIAPLLGLLGTVMGMITTFDVIAEFGTGNSNAMANGISQALVTTQTGLVVAVPGLFIGNILKRRAKRFKEDISSFCFALLMESEEANETLHEHEAPSKGLDVIERDRDDGNHTLE